MELIKVSCYLNYVSDSAVENRRFCLIMESLATNASSKHILTSMNIREKDFSNSSALYPHIFIFSGGKKVG